MALNINVLINEKGAEVFNKLKNQVVGLSKETSGLEKTLGTLGKVMGAGAVIGAAAKFIDMASEEDRALKRLQNSVNTVGQAYAFNANEVKKITGALQAKTNYADDAQIAALAELTIKTGDYNQALDILPNVLDLAAYSQTDLSTAADAYGKLVQGNITGLGKEFASLKNLAKQGATTAEIMKHLNAMMAGNAEIDVDPLTQFKNAVSDAGENVGKFFLPTLEAANKVFSVMPDNIKAVAAALPVLAVAFATMGGPITIIAAAITGLGFAIDKIGDYTKKEVMTKQPYVDALWEEANASIAVKKAQEAKLAVDERYKSVQEQIKKFQKDPAYKNQASEERTRLTNELLNLRAINEQYDALIKKRGGKPPPKISNYTALPSATFGEFTGIDIGYKDKGGGMSSMSDRDKMIEEQNKGSALLLQLQSEQAEKEFSMLVGKREMFAEFNDESLQQELDSIQIAYEEKYGMMAYQGGLEVELAELIAKKKQQANDIYAANVLSTAGTMIGALASLNTAMKGNAKVSQGLLIGETIMNTSAAIMKIMAQGGIFATPLAIATGIQGAAQVATIASQKFADGGWTPDYGTSRSDSIPAMLSKNERVVSAQETARAGGKAAIDAAIAGGGSGGVVVNIQGSVIAHKDWIREEFMPVFERESRR